MGVCPATGGDHEWVSWDERPRGGVFEKCAECDAQPDDDEEAA